MDYLDDLDIGELLEESNQRQQQRLEEEPERIEQQLSRRDQVHREIVNELESKLDWYKDRLEALYKQKTEKTGERKELKNQITSFYRQLREEKQQHWHNKLRPAEEANFDQFVEVAGHRISVVPQRVGHFVRRQRALANHAQTDIQSRFCESERFEEHLLDVCRFDRYIDALNPLHRLVVTGGHRIQRIRKPLPLKERRYRGSTQMISCRPLWSNKEIRYYPHHPHSDQQHPPSNSDALAVVAQLVVARPEDRHESARVTERTRGFRIVKSASKLPVFGERPRAVQTQREDHPDPRHSACE